MPKCEVMMTFTHDEVNQKIPYRLICEARDGCRWNTGRRRQRWQEQFSKQERDSCSRLFNLARRWYLGTGAPNVVRMSGETFALWMKLAQFCAEL